MKFTSFGGTTFASLNVTASLPNDTPDRERSPLVLQKLGQQGKVVGMQGGARAIPVYFMVKPTFDIEQTILALIAALDQDNENPRALVGLLNDGATNVQVMARPGSYVARPGDTKGLLVTFYTDDRRWTKTTVTTDGPTSFSATGTRTLAVGGQGRTMPTLKLGWSVQRPSSSATMGWTLRRRITVTNLSGQAMRNTHVQLGPINTAALTAAGKLQVSAADLVVFDDKGRKLRRGIAGNTNGANNRATFVTFVVDELAAGASRTYDVCYGNPSATAPASDVFPYTYPGSPTPDITGIDGQASAGAVGSITLVAGQALDPNRLTGGTLILTGASTARGGQMRRVGSHTTAAPAVVTPTRNFTTAPDTTTGYVIVGGGFMGDGGQASATTATTLTDAAQSWFTNEWIGAIVEAITLSTTMGTVLQFGTVTGNSATQLVVSGWTGGTPSGTAIYRVYKRNGAWNFRVSQDSRSQTNHRGRWRINAGLTRPSQMWFRTDGSPGAWSLTTYNPSDAKNDYNQPRSTGTNTGSSVDWFAVLNASIGRKDGPRLPEKGYANGCSLYVPFGILGVRHDYKIKNPDGMARAVFAAKERGGEDWNIYKEDSAVAASLTARLVAYYDLTSLGTPLHLLAALTSDDDADIDKNETGTANLQDGNVLEVRIDARNLVVGDFETATEDVVYDFSLTLRRGGVSEVDGDDVVVVGGDERHIFIKSTEKVWVGPIGDRPLAARIYSGSTYVRDIPNSVLVQHVANDATGTPQREVSSEVLPLTPGSPVLRISDHAGAIGTVNVQLDWYESYM